MKNIEWLISLAEERMNLKILKKQIQKYERYLAAEE